MEKYSDSTFESNFGSLRDILYDIIENGAPVPADLKGIKEELNKIFKDSECKEVLYTNNIDKMFFGIKITPIVDADDIYDILIDNDPYRITEYIIELDSHLLNPAIALNSVELMSMIVHEVGSMVGDSEPVEMARNVLNCYLASNNDHLKISDSIHYRELLAFGLKDYLSKSRSMFYSEDVSDMYADEFIAMYGLSDDLVSAYNKVASDNMKIYENGEVSKFITFAWTLRIYRSLRTSRIGCIKTLTAAKHLTGSRLEKIEIDNVINRVKRIDDDILIESSLTNSIREKIKKKLKKSRMNTLRSIDDAFYELNMQIRNVEDENDALYLMRQINNNMSIIDEYINADDCDDYERDKWQQTYIKFTQLREKLSSTTVYKNKNYGLFVNYPEIVENRY